MAFRLVLAALVLAGIPTVAFAERSIEFAGFTWEVRRALRPEGPGPNLFADTPRAVQVDDAGELHLRILNRNGRWSGAEVRLEQETGYGVYRFETRGPLVFSSPNVILGLFTYDHSAAHLAYREIDVEYGRFGDPLKLPAQVALQPYDVPGNRLEFELPSRFAGAADTVAVDAVAANAELRVTHAFRWTAGSIEFRVIEGSVENPFALAPDDPALIAQWHIAGAAVPAPGASRVHINLWLFGGQPPDDEQEVVITSFAFTPGQAREDTPGQAR